MFEEKANSCSFPDELVGINLAFACFDAIIAILAFTQLARIHSRNTQLGWTRQKRVVMLAVLLWFCSHGFPRNSIICNVSSAFVILVTVLLFLLMMTFSVLIWIGMEENLIDSSTMSRVYVDLFATAILLLGGALACYGLLLCRKMRNVRSERASSEIWKVAGLAIVSVVSFTSSAFVAIFTDIPMLYHWHGLHIDGVYTSLLLILYYFIGSSVPSAFVLWVMRELPPMSIANTQEESTTVTFIADNSAHRIQNRTMPSSSPNQHSHREVVPYDRSFV
ncbi:hypothetical protein V6N13_084373 [Hibiscus sabdariffa]